MATDLRVNLICNHTAFPVLGLMIWLLNSNAIQASKTSYPDSEDQGKHMCTLPREFGWMMHYEHKASCILWALKAEMVKALTKADCHWLRNLDYGHFLACRPDLQHILCWGIHPCTIQKDKKLGNKTERQYCSTKHQVYISMQHKMRTHPSTPMET